MNKHFEPDEKIRRILELEAENERLRKKRVMLPPNAIWLIDLGDDVTWCDVPDPSPGIDPADVKGPYILDADKRIAELEAKITAIKSNM